MAAGLSITTTSFPETSTGMCPPTNFVRRPVVLAIAIAASMLSVACSAEERPGPAVAPARVSEAGSVSPGPGQVWAGHVRPWPVLFGPGPMVLRSDGEGRYVDVTPSDPGGARSILDTLFLDARFGWAVLADFDAQRATVVRTTDGGRHWDRPGFGFDISMAAGTSATLEFVDADHGWITYFAPHGRFTRVHATRDGGRRWEVVDAEAPTCDTSRFASATHGFLGAGAWGCWAFFESTDSGATWVERKVGLPGGAHPDEATYFPPTFWDASGVLPVLLRSADNPRVAFYRSSDSGRTWASPSVVEAPGAGPRTAIMAVASPHVWWLAAGDGSALLVTDDGGQHWVERRPQGLDGHVGRLEAVDGRTAWATVNRGAAAEVLATDDGGATWRPVYEPEARSWSCPNVGPKRVSAVPGTETAVDADLDGDGRRDRFRLYGALPGGDEAVDGPARPADSDPQWRVRVELAAGAVMDVPTQTWWSGPEAVGAIDVDGDGRDEVVIDPRDGATAHGIGFAVLARCLPREVVGADEATFRPLYYQNSMCCPGEAVGVDCADVAGDPRLELVTTDETSAGEWSYTAYRLAGDHAFVVSTGRGTGPAGRPSGLRFTDGFECRGFHYPGL